MIYEVRCPAAVLSPQQGMLVLCGACADQLQPRLLTGGYMTPRVQIAPPSLPNTWLNLPHLLEQNLLRSCADR